MEASVSNTVGNTVLKGDAHFSHPVSQILIVVSNTWQTQFLKEGFILTYGSAALL